MKAKFIIAAAVITATLSSCNLYRYSEARITPVESDVVVLPPTARVDVGKRVSKEYVFDGQVLKSYKKTVKSPNTLRDKLAVEATHSLLMEEGADVLVAPLYKIYEKYKDAWVVEISGYLGTYVNWDKNAVDLNSLEKVNTVIAR